MKVSVDVLLRGALWTLGGFGGGQAIRFVSNVILTRMLAPELFGLMTIVNTLRTGIELMSDFGIGQNLIYSQNAEEPEFYNTAWTLQITRGLVLFLIILASSVPLARFYELPILVYLLPITGLGTILSGLTSLAPVFLQKRLQFGKLNVFQLFSAAASSTVLVLFCYLSHTIWALVLGGVFGAVIYTVASYSLLTEIKHRLFIDKRFISEILTFGKWISLSSVVYFLSMNFDRLYFAKVVPLELLGVYGIARSMSDLLGLLAGRLGSGVVFPFISSHSDTPRASLHGGLAPIRVKFLLLAAVGCSLLVATADLAIKILYDQRYQAAGWILPVLLIASWFSIVTSLSESTLLGLGAPFYMAISNSLKFVLLLLALPLSFKFGGLAGAVTILPLAEACRYVPLYLGQRRQGFSFGTQDLSATIGMFLMIGVWEGLRWLSGLGTSFDSFPIGGLLPVGP